MIMWRLRSPIQPMSRGSGTLQGLQLPYATRCWRAVVRGRERWQRSVEHNHPLALSPYFAAELKLIQHIMIDVNQRKPPTGAGWPSSAGFTWLLRRGNQVRGEIKFICDVSGARLRNLLTSRYTMDISSGVAVGSWNLICGRIARNLSTKPHTMAIAKTCHLPNTGSNSSLARCTAISHRKIMYNRALSLASRCGGNNE